LLRLPFITMANFWDQTSTAKVGALHVITGGSAIRIINLEA
jgi:hypothetical protein